MEIIVLAISKIKLEFVTKVLKKNNNNVLFKICRALKSQTLLLYNL